MDAKDMIRTLFEQGWNEQSFGPLRDRLAPEVTFHYRGASWATNQGELEGLVAHWRTAFPDLRFEVGALVEEGDVVAARLHYTGTHRGTREGVEATGNRIDVDEMMFFRFDQGLLVEAWEVQDELALLRQIGAID